ncbi:hypothetical protein STEG23_017789, partial [Scotinomys teguina]
VLVSKGCGCLHLTNGKGNSMDLPTGLDTHLKISSKEPGKECKSLREINTDLGYLSVMTEGSLSFLRKTSGAFKETDGSCDVFCVTKAIGSVCVALGKLLPLSSDLSQTECCVALMSIQDSGPMPVKATSWACRELTFTVAVKWHLRLWLCGRKKEGLGSRNVVVMAKTVPEKDRAQEIAGFLIGCLS